jgi:uncharacterized protein YidB (DUF937 family)
MSGLDDLIGSLTKKSSSGGAGIEDRRRPPRRLRRLVTRWGGLEDLLGAPRRGGSTDGSGCAGGASGSGATNVGALVGALAPMIIGMLRSGGLQKLIQGLQQKGLGAQADSWVSTGGNEKVSGSEMRVGLGDDEVRQFAQEAGISEDEAADVLATVVPQVVNGLTPDGHVPSDDELEALLRQLQPA